MGVFYLLCWRRNYPQVTGTRPATGAIARCKNKSTEYARRDRSVRAWRWICGVKPKPKGVNKPSPHFIVHGLDRPGVFTTVSHSIGFRGGSLALRWLKQLTP
jgi:hypothetical protein